MKKRAILIVLFCVLGLLAKTGGSSISSAGAGVAPYSDVRNLDVSAYSLGLDLIRTLWFNENTKWSPGDAAFASQVMDQGKNPGLLVRSLLHAVGIQGTGVNVAIIDQNMFLDHPEFAGKIVEYADFGCNMTDGSMHGPAVTSLLIGSTIGTAPGARVYYAAVPSWKLDAAYYADALNWIISRNAQLAEGNKIRVVSVSAAPSDSLYANGTLWDQARSLAEAAGILVLDCTTTQGIIKRCYYDAALPDVVSQCTPGTPQSPYSQCAAESEPKIHAPSSLRTQAEHYKAGVFSYQYTGVGGLSWAIPYVAGVLAMGWQLRPDLTGDEMVSGLRYSAHKKGGCGIINPLFFIFWIIMR